MSRLRPFLTHPAQIFKQEADVAAGKKGEEKNRRNSEELSIASGQC